MALFIKTFRRTEKRNRLNKSRRGKQVVAKYSIVTICSFYEHKVEVLEIQKKDKELIKLYRGIFEEYAHSLVVRGELLKKDSHSTLTNITYYNLKQLATTYGEQKGLENDEDYIKLKEYICQQYDLEEK